MQPHRMNLKGPWDYEWLSGRMARPDSSKGVAAQNDALPSGQDVRHDRSQADEAMPLDAGRLKMPADWQSAFGGVAGTVRFRRRFGCPTNLDPDERVSLVLDGVGGTGRVALNGQSLGVISETDDTARFEITELLQPRNELTVDLHFDPAARGDPGGLWAPVAIEVRTD